MKEIIGAQGEITIVKIDAIPKGMETKPVEKTDKGFIISHSESGHHHILAGGGVQVMERTSNVPAGMQILYGIVNGEGDLVQDAPTPHGGYTLPEGLYEFRISREYDPFSEQARRVAD